MNGLEKTHIIPTVYSFLDYREFLKEFYKLNKAKKNSFSYRFIAARVGFKSPSLMTQVFQGKANLTSKMVSDFSEFIGLNPDERKYFEVLVQYNQSKGDKQQKKLYEDLLTYRHSHVEQLGVDKFSLYEKWYYVAIRELLNFYSFKGNYDKLGRKIIPHITSEEAKNAVETLESLDIVQQEEDGEFRLKDKLITTGRTRDELVVKEYQRTAIELGKRATLSCASTEREISTLTCSVSETGYKEILKKLKQVRRQILEIAKNDSQVERVYQVNIQVFPLSERGNI